MAGREAGTSRGSFRTIAVLTLVPIAGLLLFASWSFLRARFAERAVPAATATEPAPQEPVRLAAINPPPPVPPPASSATMVLILDDVGFDGQPLEKAMTLDRNINFAILPNGTRTSEFSERLHARGFEILCHLPMEPLAADISPGEDAVLTSMSDADIAATTRRNLLAVRYARGVNNHMGSRATSDRRVMRSVIGALPRGMYFVDSKTGGRSIAANVAREMGVRTAEREVFLDNVQSEHAIREQIAVAEHLARKHGMVVAIGHLHRATVDVLARELPAMGRRGVRFVRASEIVN